MTTRSFNENRSRALVKGYNYYDLYFFFLHFQTFYIINILKRITEGHFVGHDAFIFITRTMHYNWASLWTACVFIMCIGCRKAKGRKWHCVNFQKSKSHINVLYRHAGPLTRHKNIILVVVLDVGAPFLRWRRMCHSPTLANLSD